MIPHVYIAGKFTGASSFEVSRNCFKALELAAQVVDLGAYPVIPHATGLWMQDGGSQQPDWWYDVTREQCLRCDALLTVYGWRESVGAVGEVDAAEEAGLPVFHSVVALKDWLAYLAEVEPSDGQRECSNGGEQ